MVTKIIQIRKIGKSRMDTRMVAYIAFSVAIVLGIVISVIYCKYFYNVEDETYNIEDERYNVEDETLRSAIKYFKIVNR